MTRPLKIEPPDAVEEERIAAELSGREWLSYRGALELKHRIESKWAERGHRITIHVVGEFVAEGRGVVFGLQSDAINGMPPEQSA